MVNEFNPEFSGFQKPPETLGDSEPASNSEKDTFIESPEMISLKVGLIEALQNGDNERISELAGRYRELGEQIADEQTTSRGRVRLDIAFAQILRESGREEDCLEYLTEALYCARQEGFEDIVAELERLIDTME